MESWQDYSRFFISLVAIVDPFAVIPAFLSMTAGASGRMKGRAARYIILTVFSTLVLAALTGDLVLTILGASLDAFRVGGGAVLMTMAFTMLREPVLLKGGDATGPSRFEESIGIAPLGIPLLAGPGAISATIIQMQRGEGALHFLAILACITLACFVLWLCLRLADSISRSLGVQGLTALNKLFGLLLAAVAAQIMANGLLGLFPGLR